MSGAAAATGGSTEDAAGPRSTGTFAAADAVELAVVERSGFVESRHVGSAVVLSPSGEVLSTLGDPSAPIIPRSCLKPFQALAVLRALGSGASGSGASGSGASGSGASGSGAALDAVQTVLATASHAGTPEHVAVVESILQLAGLAPDALQCPHDWPGSSAARDGLVRAGLDRSPLYMNCSGKHAAMLLACAVNGWPTETYLEPSHPLQQRILATIEELTGETVAASAVDGCGAPVYAVSLLGLARGIGRITQALPLAPIIAPVDADAAAGAPHTPAAHLAADVFVAATVEQGAVPPPAGEPAPRGPHHHRLVSAEAATLTASVLANGWAIDGPGRANTLCIDELAVFSKLGAEGVMVMSTTAASPAPAAAGASTIGTHSMPTSAPTAAAPASSTAAAPAPGSPTAAASGTGSTAAAPAPGSATAEASGTAGIAHSTAGTTVALKVLDGNLRAATLVGLTLLVQAGALTQDSVDALLPCLDLTVYGGTVPVGSIRLTDALAPAHTPAPSAPASLA